jgi:cell division transport system ATP-binding protein
VITIDTVTKRFGKRAVLDGVSFSVRPNEFACITGPSGAGKTTLMHILIGAENFDSGSVLIDGVELRNIPTHALQLYRRRLGIVFQDYKLLWNRTVAENIAFPLEVCGASDTVIAKRVQEVLAQMQLTGQADVLCHALSGGEKARTAIARAIAHKPMVILADEPTGNLDPEESMRILQLLKDIHAAGSTIVLATHDTRLVDALRTRVIRLDGGKITRDSVGSYHEPEEKTTEAAEPAHHKPAAHHPTHHAAHHTTHTHKPAGGKSVKIISTSR